MCVQIELEVTLTPGMATCALYLRDEQAFWVLILTKGPSIDPNEMRIQVIDGFGCYMSFVDANVEHVPVRFWRKVHTD